jgi:hypothetical protein
MSTGTIKNADPRTPIGQAWSRRQSRWIEPHGVTGIIDAEFPDDIGPCAVPVPQRSAGV